MSQHTRLHMVDDYTFDNSMLFTFQPELVPILLTDVHESKRERMIKHPHMRNAQLAHPSPAIKASFNHSANISLMIKKTSRKTLSK